MKINYKKIIVAAGWRTGSIVLHEAKVGRLPETTDFKRYFYACAHGDNRLPERERMGRTYKELAERLDLVEAATEYRLTQRALDMGLGVAK